MLKISSASLLSIAMLIASCLVQAEDFRLDFNDSTFGGFQTVDLQQELYLQHQVEASRLDIEQVDVMLKSRFGGGLVWTGSPYNQRDRRVVSGQPENFYNPSGWNFDHISFPASGYADDLLLNLNGQFMLREVFIRTRE